METRHIKEVMAEALKGGNWLAFKQGSALQDYAFCFFLSKEEAAAFCHNHTSERNRWDVAYLPSPERLLQIAKGNPQILDQQFLKQIHMNEQHVNYLKENIKYMGFGEKLHADLEQRLAEGKPEFQLLFQASVNQKPFEAVLHFRKSDNSDRYFFNSYTAKLEKEDPPSREQTFYLNNGKGVTAKEAFNLLEGRAVFKELMDKGGHIYEAWIQLDFSSKDKQDNYLIKQFHGNYGYDLATSLSGLPFKELHSSVAQRMELMKSLQKGNRQAVTMEKEDKQERVFIEANPQYKTINIYDGQMKRLKKEEVFPNSSKAASAVKEKPQPEPEGRGEKLQDKAVHTDKGIKGKEQKEKANNKAEEDSLLPKKKTNHTKGLSQ